MNKLWRAIGSSLAGFSILFFTTYAHAALEIEEAYVRETPPGQSVAAVFLRFVNTGDEPIVLVAAESEQAKQVEFHQHAHHNGMMRMEKMDELLIPPHQTVVFEPGSYHLMLIDKDADLVAGDRVDLVVTDRDGTDISFVAPVKRS